jgi:predicted AAA+ superfamily ATPase
MEKRIPRILDEVVGQHRAGRASVVYGPRRVGKTNLVEHYLTTQQRNVLRASGDDVRVRNLLQGQDAGELLAWVSGYDTLFLDEAQRIPDVGWALKILVDSRAELQVIATGSASFALAGQLGEPLTGRQTPLKLFPVSVMELSGNDYELRGQLEDLLVYGMYPEVRIADNPTDKRDVLRELTSSYLYKDILELDRVRNSKTLMDLLTLLALQVGREVSLNELATALGIDVKTVARYLDLFEKSFVLYNLRGFSRNLRNEVTKTSKWFFYDTGVRNAVINNLNPLKLRDDVGALWENFVLMERVKALTYARRDGSFHFWRTWNQQEIDLIEDRDGGLHAFEMKFNPSAKARCPETFLTAYPQSDFSVITPANLLTSLRQISGA